MRRVAISGFPFFVHAFFGKNSETLTGWRHTVLQPGALSERLAALWNLFRSDVWYSIGSFSAGRACDALARIVHKRRVIHWVGSDILNAQRDPKIVREFASASIMHLVESPHNQRELRDLGIDARLAPLPPVCIPTTVPALPRVCTVLFYVPRTRADFYGAACYERLITAFADDPMRFYVVGGGTLHVPKRANVVDLGYRNDLADIYPQVTMLVRFAEHDGVSLMVLEALAFGRYVLWRERFPFAYTTTTYEEIEQQLRALLKAHVEGRLHVRENVARYVSRRFGRERCLRHIAQQWEQGMHARR